ncbi:MAG TPA: transposase, partial [Clostridiales bacterium]|nr:transposase [Clostridiales bacterium]
MQDIEIKNIENSGDTTHLFCEIKRKPHKCPHCGKMTNAIHDYRMQIIKDVPSFGNNLYIHLRKRRYRCSCGKRFYENVSFLPKYHRMTNRLVCYVLDKLRNECSFTSVAREVN